MKTITKKLTLLLQTVISITTGVLAAFFALLIKMPNQFNIFIISSLSCFIAISFTIWNIKRTFKTNFYQFNSKNFFDQG